MRNRIIQNYNKLSYNVNMYLKLGAIKPKMT